MGDILRVFVIVAGVYMFLKAILSLAKRKMTEPFCLAWAFLAALMVLAGILLNPVQLDNFISFRGLILVILVISGLLWDLWFISSQVSILKRRNQELEGTGRTEERAMKKVLFVINTLGGAGAERALLELLKRFSPQQYEIDLYVLLDQGELIHEVPEYVNLVNGEYFAESVLSAEGKKKLGKTVWHRLWPHMALAKNFIYLLRKRNRYIRTSCCGGSCLTVGWS